MTKGSNDHIQMTIVPSTFGSSPLGSDRIFKFKMYKINSKHRNFSFFALLKVIKNLIFSNYFANRSLNLVLSKIFINIDFSLINRMNI